MIANIYSTGHRFGDETEQHTNVLKDKMTINKEAEWTHLLSR